MTKSQVDARAKEIKAENSPGGVGPYIKMVGAFFLIATALCVFAVILQIINGRPLALAVYCGLSTLIGGLLCLALAEILERLGEIVRLLRK